MYTKIKMLCEKKHISIYKLETALGLSLGSICKWNKSVPRADNLQKVANFFDVRIDYFVFLEADKR